MSFIKKLGLSVLSGLLFSVAWPERGFAPLIFIAFVPLLLISYDLKKQRAGTLQITFFAYIAFVLWNMLTTYWVWFSSPPGGVAAIVLLSLFFTIVYTAFQFTYKYLPGQWGLLSLPIYWIAFEKFHLEWDLTWPWLTLGNVFSENYQWVQWYEYTGVFGGTAWVFAANILFFIVLVKFDKADVKKVLYPGLIFAGIVLIPIVLSVIRYNGYAEKTAPVNVLVVQPNIDPYNEKFASGTFIQQTEKFIKLAQPHIDPTVDYIIGPETALSAGIEEDFINEYTEVQLLRKMLKGTPKALLVTGASSYRHYKKWETPSATARKDRQGNYFYDSYNTAMQLDTTELVQYSHKSKLVPGVERMPTWAGFLEKYAIDLGGMTGSLGRDTIQHVFVNHYSGMKIAPSICYESVYGEYMGEFVKKGAQLIFIITNDGWWRDTPGHRQHCSYARLRAIESRRSIARSANTGISCFINQRGEMFQATKYWEPAAIKQTINANTELTFYTLHGDYIARICNWLLLLFLAGAVWLKVKVFRERKKQVKK
jgi:apolipoprotein N-acyltransferase